MTWRGWVVGLMGATLVGIMAGCGPSQAEHEAYTPDEVRIVTEWMDNLYGAIRVERISPPRAARIYGYAGVTFYEAMVHGLPELSTLTGQLNDLEAVPTPDSAQSYDWLTVAITAQRQMADTLFADASATARVQLQELAQEHLARRQQDVSAPVYERSVAYGTELGAALTAWAGRDGYATRNDAEYDRPEGDPQHWVPTATAAQNTALMASPATDFVDLSTNADTREALDPEMASERMLVVNRPDSWLNPHRALEPYWHTLRPPVLDRTSACRPEPPVPYSWEPGSPFYKQVKAVYDTSQTLSEEQITIARFWSDCPGHTGTPPGHWARIGSQLVDQLNLSMTQTVEMFAMLGLSMHEAFLSAWDEKYRSNLVRPVTVIQRHLDPSWQTQVVTPPFPEYTSAHSVVSAAAATVLTHLFGTVAFTDRSMAWLGFEPRRWDSFHEAALEAANSRIYGGIHYPMASYNGLDQGNCVGQQVVDRIRTRPSASAGAVAEAPVATAR